MKIWWIAAYSGVLGVALIVALLVGVFTGKQQTEIVTTPDINKPPIEKIRAAPFKVAARLAQPEYPTVGRDRLDQDDKGRDVPTTDHMTPCRLLLPPATTPSL